MIRFMMTTVCIVFVVLLSGNAIVFGAPALEARISDGPVRVRIYLPDANGGFYRGTRFDWSGMIGSLEYGGHDYYPQWFQRLDPPVHNFIYDGADIVAGASTAAVGPAEEFAPLGFDETNASGTFVKVGVGVLRKPDDKKYDMFRLYPIADGGKWTVIPKRESVEFRQELADSSGYSYEYRKTVSVKGNQMVLDHKLRNTGKRVIETSVYNHNFLYLDRQRPGPDFSVTVPFTIDTSKLPTNTLAEVHGNQISFSKALAGEDRVYLDLRGFRTNAADAAKDYDIRVENRQLKAGLRITCDRPMSRLALWSIRAPLSIEPFIDINIPPGRTFTWRIQYDYYTIAEGRK